MRRSLLNQFLVTYWENIFEMNHNEKTQIISLSACRYFHLLIQKEEEERLGYFLLHCVRTLGAEHIDLIILVLIMELILPRELRRRDVRRRKDRITLSLAVM